MASVEVLWSVIKGHSAFLLKRGQGSGGQSIFSTEKGNLRNRHSIRYNGLINKKAVDVSATEGGVAVSVKRNGLSQKPSAIYVTSKQPAKNGFRKGRNAAANATSKYRPDLRRAALARYSAIKRIGKNTQSKGHGRRPTLPPARPKKN